MRRLIILASVVMLATGVTLSAQSQGKGKGKPGSSQGEGSTLTLVMFADQNGNGAPNWGDSVVFEVFTADTSDPQVQVMCFQNGDVVYGAVWPTTPVLTLASRAWQGGAADCTASAYYFSGNKNVTIASMNFRVEE